MAIGTYVLVHGAWHGGWCWAKVARLLRDAGHEVYTPTLTGLGERAHLARPDIDLDTHIQDVVAVLEAEELRQVTLVGHSYGGMVISGAAARTSGRIGHLVYLDAFVPEAGKCLLDYVGERAAAMREAAATQGEGWTLPPFSPDGVPTQTRLTFVEPTAWAADEVASRRSAAFMSLIRPSRLVSTMGLFPCLRHATLYSLTSTPTTV